MLKTPYRSRKSVESTPSTPGPVLHDSNSELGRTTAVPPCRKSGASFTLPFTLPPADPLSGKVGWRRMQSPSRFIARVKSRPVKPHLCRAAWSEFTFLHNLSQVTFLHNLSEQHVEEELIARMTSCEKTQLAPACISWMSDMRRL
jgi:hypothetical protein